MKDLVIKILTVLLVVSFIIAIPISIIKGHVQKSIEKMTLDATYICENESDIKLKFTETFGNTPEGYVNTDDSRIVYLYVDGREYYGLYRFGLADKFNKVINTTFYDSDLEPGKGICLHFDYSKKKLTITSITHLINGFSNDGAFEENQVFVKKTWWNTWGSKLCIILIIAFAVWKLRPFEIIMNKKYREKTINEFKQSKKE